MSSADNLPVSMPRSRVSRTSDSVLGTKLRKRRSALSRLPLEIFVMIHRVSEKPAQVMLSLTCRALFNVTYTKLDHSTCSFEDRIAISRLLEIDWPEYLTCRLCGALFKWRDRRHFNYACPRSEKHDPEAQRSLQLLSIPVQAGPAILLNIEVRDLIYRYYERGSYSGLSANFLNREGRDGSNNLQHTSARWTNGQLLVQVDNTLRFKKWLLVAKRKKIQICPHLNNVKPWTEWRASDETVYLGRTTRESKTLKCCRCSCDATVITEQSKTKGSIKVAVKVWRSYGSSSSDFDERNFRSSSYQQQIDGCDVARRNLCKLFEGGEDDSSEYDTDSDVDDDQESD